MEFMNLLRGEENHTFSVMSSYIGSLKDIKYIITLDADTFMPRDSAIKLVGAMSHILNRACVKNNFVKQLDIIIAYLFTGYNKYIRCREDNLFVA